MDERNPAVLEVSAIGSRKGRVGGAGHGGDPPPGMGVALTIRRLLYQQHRLEKRLKEDSAGLEKNDSASASTASKTV